MHNVRYLLEIFYRIFLYKSIGHVVPGPEYLTSSCEMMMRRGYGILPGNSHGNLHTESELRARLCLGYGTAVK